MLGRLGWAEILVIVVLLLILFGHSKIPTMMKNLANGINVFKSEMKKSSVAPEKKDVVQEKKTAPKAITVKKKTVKSATKKKLKK